MATTPEPGSTTVSDHDEVTTGRTLDQVPDPDPQETSDWLASLSDVVQREGPVRARFLLRRVLEHAGEHYDLTTRRGSPATR